mgnify:CR=1 FL=1
MISSRLIKSNDVAAGCENIVDAYDPFGDLSGFALYQLNGNASDVSGTYNGNPIDVSWGSPGVFGTSALLNGTTSYIDTSISSNIFNNDCSFSFWGKTTDTGNNCFFGTYNAQTALVECFFNLTTGQLRVYFRNSAASTVAVSSTFSNMNDGEWHHVVVTKTNSTIKAYVDGNAEINAAIPGGTYGNSTTIKLGRRQSITSTDENFNGPIDQVRFFNRELGGGSILDLGCYPISFAELFRKNSKDFKLIKTSGNFCFPDVDDHAEIKYIINDSILVNAKVSFKENLSNDCTIYGSKKKMRIISPWLPEKKTIIEIIGNENYYKKFVLCKNEIYANQLNIVSNFFMNDFNSDSKNLVTIDKSYQIFEILDCWKKDLKDSD